MSYPPPDYLPYIDGDITPQERAAAELLVSAELASLSPTKPSENHKTSDDHPKSSDEPPKESMFRSVLMQDIEEYEKKNGNKGQIPDSIITPVVDLRRYHDFSPDSPDYKAIYTAVSYAILRERSSRLQLQNEGDLAVIGKSLNAELANVAEIQNAEISRKRNALEEVHDFRAFKQQRFTPVHSHLNSRWQNGIRSMVDSAME